MSNYCPHCGKRVSDVKANFCSKCGYSLDNQFNEPNNIPWKKPDPEQNHPAAGTIRSLNTIAGILCLIFGIIFLIIGIITLIVFIGIFFLIIAMINFFIKSKIDDINKLIKQGNYQKAKEDQLILMIIGFIFGGIIIGVILLIGYIKYDDIDR
jgi:hypothetical protein